MQQENDYRWLQVQRSCQHFMLLTRTTQHSHSIENTSALEHNEHRCVDNQNRLNCWASTYLIMLSGDHPTIVKSAITQPAQAIIENAEMEGFVIGKHMNVFNKGFNKGFDAAKDRG